MVLYTIIQKTQTQQCEVACSFLKGSNEMNANNEPEAVTTVGQEQKRGAEKEIAKMAPRWAAIIGLLAIGVLYALLPQRLRIGPNWLLLVIEIVALLPLVIVLSTQRRLSHRAIRIYAMILLDIVTLALAISILLLIISLPTNKHATDLLGSAAVLWSVNVLVFALWYWEIDGGGPLNGIRLVIKRLILCFRSRRMGMMEAGRHIFLITFSWHSQVQLL